MLEIRGLGPGEELRLGPVAFPMAGSIRVKLADAAELRCHLGHLAVAVDGTVIGEIEIVPGKLTARAWDALRADLQRVWTGLLFNPAGSTSVEATGPDPADLWRRLAPVATDLTANPVQVLGSIERLVRRDRVRRANELTTSVVLAAERGRPGRSLGLGPCVSEPERALIRDCLLRLSAYALSHPRGESTSRAVDALIARGPYAAPSKQAVVVSHLARHEPRLRQVVQIRQELLNLASAITEGPGDLRLGIQGLDRLYEYWVYLSVLEQLRDLYGPPLGSGFDVIGRPLAGGRIRLELPAGTVVEFPGGVAAAFNPTVSQAGARSWLGLELAGHPPASGMKTQSFITPDVIVARQEGNRVELVVIDAKYRVRHQLDASLWDVYVRYSRIRHRGTGVVRGVAIAHPHDDFRLVWPGQLAVPFIPGMPATRDWLPDNWVSDAPSLVGAEAADSPVSVPERTTAAAASGGPSAARPVPPQPAPRNDEPSADFLRRYALSPEMGRSAQALVGFLSSVTRPTWRTSLLWLVRRFAAWDLEGAEGATRLPLSTLGVLQSVANQVLDGAVRVPGSLLRALSDVLREVPELRLGIDFDAHGLPVVVRSLIAGPAIWSEDMRIPRSVGGAGEDEADTSPHLSCLELGAGPPIVVLDQDWTWASLGGRRMDLDHVRSVLAPEGSLCVVIGFGLGSVAQFHAAARQCGWVTLATHRRADTFDVLERLLRYTKPSRVTLVSGLDDICTVAQSSGVRVSQVSDLESLLS